MFLDIFCEFMFDLILEGAIAGATSRKVPLFLRIILLGAIIVLYGGLILIVFHIAIKEKSILTGIVGVLIFIIVLMAVWKRYEIYKAKKANESHQL